VKLLGASALRARLAGDLELLAVRQSDRPARQQTLRNAVTWSYELLPPELQRFLRQLGAFAGEFDLEAAQVVAGEGIDALDAVGELADVSLVSIREGPDGEPRVHLLRTIAAFARRWLDEAGELDAVLRRHAEHYASVVEQVAPQLRGSYVVARDRIEADLDNVRAALAWALPETEGADGPPADRAAVGLRLSTAMSWFWYASGYRYQAEARRWLTRAIEGAAGREGPDLMTSLHGLAVLLLQHGEYEPARDALLRCLAYWREDGDPSRICKELSSLGAALRSLGELAAARAALEESIGLARATGNEERLPAPLSNLALVDLDEGRCGDAMVRLEEALALDEAVGDVWGVAADRVNIVGVLVQDGRTEEAHAILGAGARSAVALGDVELTVSVIELFAMVFAGEGDARRAARLFGASQEMRRRAELPIDRADGARLERAMSRVRPEDRSGWDDDVRAGSRYDVDEALAEAESAGP
jgi:tetratricopeptide (TPR) repeat protein